MSSNTPAYIRPTLYKGDTFSYLFQFEENGSALDLTSLSDITVKLFSSDKTIFEHSLSGGELTISGSNNDQLAGKASKSTMDIAVRSYFLEVTFIYADGSELTYVAGTVIITDAKDWQDTSAKEYLIKIDTTNETATSEQLTGLTAITIDAKDTTLAARDTTETYRDTTKGYRDETETFKNTTQTLRDESQTFRGDSEDHAQSTSQYTDSTGTTYDKGSKGWKQESEDYANDSELQAQSTSSFTDSEGTSFTKGAQGWANDAETFANNAETTAEDEVQEKRAEDSAFYYNELQKKHTLGKALWFPVLSSSEVVTPPSGYESLFMDADNSNALSKKDSTGTVTAI